MAQTLVNQSQVGRTVWYVMGRLYTDASGRSFDAGYFANIAGIDGPFFSDAAAQSEATALFTFSADKFEDTLLSNGDVTMSLSPPGQWRMYQSNIILSRKTYRNLASHKHCRRRGYWVCVDDSALF